MQLLQGREVWNIFPTFVIPYDIHIFLKNYSYFQVFFYSPGSILFLIGRPPKFRWTSRTHFWFVIECDSEIFDHKTFELINWLISLSNQSIVGNGWCEIVVMNCIFLSILWILHYALCHYLPLKLSWIFGTWLWNHVLKMVLLTFQKYCSYRHSSIFITPDLNFLFSVA
jgi:hypothetical protein